MKSAVDLSYLFPRAKDEILEAIDSVAIDLAKLNNPTRLSYFLAQCAHESGGFQFTKELGSDRQLRRYEGRRDLGNTRPGDGVRFCGRGIIQVTGRANYTECAEWIGLPIVEIPDLLEEPGPAVRSACWYWVTRNLNQTADLYNFVQCTKKINGGTNGLRSRQMWLKKIQGELND